MKKHLNSQNMLSENRNVKHTVWHNHRILPFHPCMNVNAHHQVARLHLPVAPQCNIQCNFCERKTSPHAVAPGITQQILSPEQALHKTGEFLKTWGNHSVVGIAGPGDPLANPETFETLSLIRRHYPKIRICLCTNGLNLPDKINHLQYLNVRYLTITINGIDPRIVAKIQPYIRQNGNTIQGEQAAQTLITHQLNGVKAAISAKMFVKINTVVIPEINGTHVAAIARKAAELGVSVFNPMPLIPRGAFHHIQPPSAEYMRVLYQTCRAELPVFEHCKQCRADAEGIPGKENNLCKKMITA